MRPTADGGASGGHDADVLIVGAGSAGCSAARAFAERGADVLVIEAGLPFDDAPESIRTVDHLGAVGAPGWTWASGIGVSGLADEHSARRRSAHISSTPLLSGSEQYVRGRGVGGGTAVNGMLTELPTPPEIIDLEARCGTGFAVALADTLALAAPHCVTDAERSRVDLAVANDLRRLGWPVHPVSLACDTTGRRRRPAGQIFLAGTAIQVLADHEVVGLDLDARTLRLSNGTAMRAPVIVLAAGALASPALLAGAGLDLGRPALDHPHVILTLSTPADSASRFVIGVRIEADGAWMLPMARTGTAETPGEHGALLVLGSDMTGVERAVRRLRSDCPHLLLDPDSGEAPSRASVFHAAGTLPIGTVLDAGGAVPGAPGYYVMDASALPSLPACGPWLTVAAAARLWAGRAEARS